MKVTPGIGQKKRQFKALLGWGKRTLDGRQRPKKSRRRRPLSTQPPAKRKKPTSPQKRKSTKSRKR